MTSGDSLREAIGDAIAPLREDIRALRESMQGAQGLFVRVDRLEQRSRFLSAGLLAGLPLVWDWIKAKFGIQ